MRLIVEFIARYDDTVLDVIELRRPNEPTICFAWIDSHYDSERINGSEHITAELVLWKTDITVDPEGLFDIGKKEAEEAISELFSGDAEVSHIQAYCETTDEELTPIRLVSIKFKADGEEGLSDAEVPDAAIQQYNEHCGLEV